MAKKSITPYRDFYRTPDRNMIINPFVFSGVGGGDLFEIAATSLYDSGTSKNSHTISMPTGTAVGDLLVVFLRHSGANVTITPPSGWAALVSGGLMRAYWKIATSDDLSSATFGYNANRFTVAITCRITGAHATDPVAGASVSTSSLDPPNLSSPWGTGDYMGLSAAGNGNTRATAGTATPPSGMTIVTSAPADSGSSSTANCDLAMQSLTSVSSFDPSAWSYSGTTSDPRANTILIRPA
jgi:hypothetical protein